MCVLKALTVDSCKSLGYSGIYRQDAQLSQRDRAAGCVIVFAKSRRLEVELGDNILLILYVCLQPL